MNGKYPLALPEGTVLAGQYIIEKVLGQGGFGITYQATDHKTNDRVAVKEFFPDGMAARTEQTTVMPFSGEKGEHYAYGKACFLQEAETLAKFIGNENIVRIHSYFEENGTAYFVMDFVEGTSFDKYLKERGGRIPYEEAAKILVPVMDALNVVHSKGIVHRDVTPDNIYITKDGVVKLLDFGAARYSLGDQSRSLDVILKHGFAPKEQYTRRGKQGPYTDIYALGATFYFALTGKRPPDSVERLDEDELVPPSTLGVKLSGTAEAAILKALNVQPADRFQSMAAFKNALLGQQAAAQSTPASTVVQTYFDAPAHTGADAAGVPAPASGQDPADSTAAGAPRKPGKNKKLLFAAAGAAAAVLVLVIGVFVFRPGGKTSPARSEETYQAAFYPDEDAATPLPSISLTLTPTATPEPAYTLSGDWAVIGNSAENIMNCGIYTSANGISYAVEDAGHSLWRENDDTYISQAAEGVFSNLILTNGQLLCLYEGSAFYYDDQAKEFVLVPELKPFSSSIQRLLLTQDFYVLCCQNDNGAYTVYRVLRATGQAEVCCTTMAPNCFTMSDDGWIYYAAKGEDDLSRLYRMRLDTLEKVDKGLVVAARSGASFCNPIVEGSYLYYCYYGDAFCTIRRMDRESGYTETDPAWNIGSELNLNPGGGFGFTVSYQNHMIYLYACQAGSDIPSLYAIRGNDDRTFEWDILSQNAYYPHLAFYNDGRYDVLFCLTNEAHLYSQTFDADGNRIQTN